MNLEISEAAYAVLQTKALALNASETAVLNAMILEFAPSTEADRKKVARMRDLARDEYLSNASKDFSLSHLYRAWSNGYRIGWTHFQIRKPNLFDLRKGEDSE